MMSSANIVDALRTRGETIAIAESVTGGGLASAITSFEGASHVLKGGIVAYSIESKVRDLSVPEKLIEEKSVYSSDVALAMASGVRNRFASNWAIATTGVAGPGPSHGINAGRVWIAVIGPGIERVEDLELSGGRSEVRAGAVASALATFARILGV